MKMKKILASLLAFAMIATLVPFAAYAEDEVDTSFMFGGSYGSVNIDTVPMSFIGGLGGKAIDDTALAFVYEGTNSTTSETRWQYPVTHIESVGTSGGKKGVYFAFNIYADGDAIARVSCANGQEIFRWNPDGSVVIPQYGIEADATTTMERGKWHKIGLSLNENNGGRFGMFVDGKKITSDACKKWSDIKDKSPMNFGIYNGSGAGTVAYDDPSCAVWSDNNGKYVNAVAPNDVVKYASSDYFLFESDNSITLKKYIRFIDTYKTNMLNAFSNVAEVRLLKEDMLTEATTFEEVKNVVVKTTTDAYYYYTVNDYERTPLEKAGIIKVADKGETADDNWLSNIVFVDGNKIGVYSSTLRNLSTVSSARLILALESFEGYKLSYVDTNKQSATTASVKDGYIKATKEGCEDMYFEITPRNNFSGPMELTALTADKRGATLTSASGVAGKDADDVSHGFAGTTYTGTTASQKEAKYYHTTEKIITTNTDGTRTYVFNMYVDGDANARIGMMYGTSAYYIMRWDGATGNLYGPETGTSMGEISYMNLETGRWHQVAITMDKGTGGRLEIYIDGVLFQRIITENIGWNNYSGLALGTYVESTSGKALYDDIEIYNGFYDIESSVVDASVPTENFLVDKDNRIIYYKNMTTASELCSAALANTNASTAAVYADATFASKADVLDNNSNVVMLTSPNGYRYEYYTLKQYSEIPAPEMIITPSTTVFNVEGKINADYTGCTMYVATYMADNTLVNITPIVLDASYFNKVFSQKFAYGPSGAKAKVFIWDGQQNPISYSEANRVYE